MNYANVSESPTVADRLEELEKQNRALKRSAIAALVAFSAFLVMGQAQVPRTITADEFILKDRAGIVRATLGLKDDKPMLQLFDSNGQAMAALADEGISFKDPKNPAKAAVLLGSSTSVQYQKTAAGGFQVLEQGPGLVLFGGNKESIQLRAMQGSSSLTLRDAQGFETVVGNTTLTTPSTGQATKSSAAFIELLDKDGKAYGVLQTSNALMQGDSPQACVDFTVRATFVRLRGT